MAQFRKVFYLKTSFLYLLDISGSDMKNNKKFKSIKKNHLAHFLKKLLSHILQIGSYCV